MKIVRRTLISISILLCVLIAMIVFHEFFLTAVIQPLAFLIWAVIRILSSVHQKVYWTILVLISFVFLIRVLPDKSSHYSKYKEIANGNLNEGYLHWRAVFYNRLGEKDRQKQIRSQLTNLLLNACAVHEQQELLQVQKRFKNHELDLPQEIYDFLLTEEDRQDALFKQIKIEIIRCLPVRLSQKLNLNPGFDASEKAITWIEHLLEIEHE